MFLKAGTLHGELQVKRSQLSEVEDPGKFFSSGLIASEVRVLDAVTTRVSSLLTGQVSKTKLDCFNEALEFLKVSINQDFK